VGCIPSKALLRNAELAHLLGREAKTFGINFSGEAQLGWKVEAGKPKSEAGDRTIGLDDITNNVLEAWRKTQIAEQLAYGPGWIRSGRIFTRPDGAELHPAEITRYFNQLVAALGLPPIRLHDLRHNAATHALEAEVDIKIVQELLSHTTSVLTRDTYTSVSPRLAKRPPRRRLEGPADGRTGRKFLPSFSQRP
jgi:integrase